MESENIYNIVKVDEFSLTPKYLQIINSIIKGVGEGKLSKGYLLPSINELGNELDVSRDTCVRVYRELKKMGVIQSVPGKGYFVSNAQVKRRIRIFLMFNKLSTHKKIIYDSFVAALGDNASISFYIYNNDYLLFKELLTDKETDFDYYVIVPHFFEGGEDAYEIMNKLPKDRLILMDKLLRGVEGLHGMVYENFEKDIYEALKKALDLLSKYHTIKIIFPEYTYYPAEIVKGFMNFCREYAFNYELINDIRNEVITDGTVYISVMEDDLVTLIEKILDTKLEVGKNVGVLSYNETPLKRIILNGITTISTDFQMMGQQAARLILEQSTEQIEVPFHLTVRNSL